MYGSRNSDKTKRNTMGISPSSMDIYILFSSLVWVRMVRLCTLSTIRYCMVETMVYAVDLIHPLSK